MHALYVVVMDTRSNKRDKCAPNGNSILMDDEVSSGGAPEAQDETLPVTDTEKEGEGTTEGKTWSETEVQNEEDKEIGKGEVGTDTLSQSEAQVQDEEGERETEAAEPDVQAKGEEGEQGKEVDMLTEPEPQVPSGEGKTVQEEEVTEPDAQVQGEEESGESKPEAEEQEKEKTEDSVESNPEVEVQGDEKDEKNGMSKPEADKGEAETALPEPETLPVESDGETVSCSTEPEVKVQRGEGETEPEVKVQSEEGGETVSTEPEAKVQSEEGEGEGEIVSTGPETAAQARESVATEVHTEEIIEEVTFTITYVPMEVQDDDKSKPETLAIPEAPIPAKGALPEGTKVPEESKTQEQSEGRQKLDAEQELAEKDTPKKRKDYGSPYTEVLTPVGGPTLSSRVETASPNDAVKDQDHTFHHPLSLHWSFGYNSKLPVHNISEGNRKMIFYASAHTGVLFDCVQNKQCLLQGHNNPISCTAVSRDRRWLATADSGQDCVLIVWDSFTGIPVRTIFDAVSDGIVAIAISPDSQFLATLSASKTRSMQAVSIWDWTVESEGPLCQVSLGPDYSYQTYMTFHHDDPHQLVSNSEDLVVFYCWKDNEMKLHSHPVLDKDFNKTIGRFFQSVFVPESTFALTGTSEGHGIMWANEGTDDMPHVKKGVKLMRLHDSPLTVMTSTLDMVVTGDKEGRVKFFDSKLKMVNWYEDTMRYGPLCSISFSFVPNIALLKSSLGAGKNITDAFGEHSYQPESTKAAAPFVIPDFTISTTSASIVYFTSNSSTPEILFNEHDASINALATHPFMPHLLTSGYTCSIKLWDYDTKLVLGTRDFGEPNFIQCVCFDPKGEFISVGFTNGTLQVLDAITLLDAGPPFRYSRDAITKIAFSHDSRFMATADLDKCVSVYVAQLDDPQKPWGFLAKYRSHFKKIESLMFGVKLDSDVPRLLSLGCDRTLVEYDLAHSKEGDLQLLSCDRIEQSAIPTAMAWYPPLTTESFILTVNNQYKVKLYNSTTKMCRRTVLGPIFGSPLKKVMVLPAPILRGPDNQELRRYLAYCTNNKVGLLLLPHDGNPHNSKCLVAHPGKVAEMTCSFDGKYIFTAGGTDCAINMWTTNTDALEAASLLGGEDLQPFYAMLEGGRDGEFFNELEEFFYYAQIRSQGPDVTSPRKVSTTIPIEEIPYVMRAIGFYPSEQEIDDMLNEVKFSKFVDEGSYVTNIDLGTFIRLYINHRPVFGLTPLQVGQAFKVLGDKLKDERYWSVDRNTLLAMLQERGEYLTEGEIIENLMTLLGYSDNPEVDGSFTEDVGTALEQIPERISAPLFAEEIIGLSTQ